MPFNSQERWTAGFSGGQLRIFRPGFEGFQMCIDSKSGECRRFPATVSDFTEQKLATPTGPRIMSNVSASESLFSSETPPNLSLGTIWIVKESLWKERIPNYDSTREKHFCLSVLRLPLVYFGGGMVPMLHGRSNLSRNCFWASGLSEEDGPDYRTYFGHLHPTPLPMLEISDNPAVKQSDLDFAWAHDCLRIRANDHKRKLSSFEKEQFIQWLKRRGFWCYRLK